MITIHCKGDLPRTQAVGLTPLYWTAQGHPETMMKFPRSSLVGAQLDICCPYACKQIAPGFSLRPLKYFPPERTTPSFTSGVQGTAFSEYCRYLGRASEI